ncbi:MAG: hypothetical protein KatS3mg035_0210 [Bacteroidia bacterium]|nr:MAG: hypothetical protein KatS3mg035_0210 [Bacteroidia bacterium]
MSKILLLDEFINTQIHSLRFFNKKVVFTNGCFDIVHKGHLDYLKKASQLGDVLVIGLNSDASVSRLKGKDRPINPLNDRASLLAFFHFIDYIIPFDEDTPIHLIHAIKPDVLVKGSDYTMDKIVGADWVLSYGGKVVTIDFLEGYSTTSIINKIKS